MKNTLRLVLVGFLATQVSFGAGKKTVGASPSAAPLIVESTQHFKEHEVLLSGGELFQTDYSKVSLSVNNMTRLNVGGAYLYRIKPYLQIGPRAGLSYAGGAVSVTIFELLGSARVNLPLNEDIENSFFAGVLVGFGTASAGLSQTSAVFGFEGGKRFLLFPNFTWQPTFVVRVPTNSGYGAVSFGFHLLSASLVF